MPKIYIVKTTIFYVVSDLTYIFSEKRKAIDFIEKLGKHELVNGEIQEYELDCEYTIEN